MGKMKHVDRVRVALSIAGRPMSLGEIARVTGLSYHSVASAIYRNLDDFERSGEPKAAKYSLTKPTPTLDTRQEHGII